MCEDLVIALSELYETAPKARAIAEGLVRIELVNADGNAIVVWASLIREAHKAGCLNDLVNRASLHYPGKKEALLLALNKYEASIRSADTRGSITSGADFSVMADTPSPFSVAGGMTLDAQSYVTRRPDHELKLAAASHAFIWLQGDFQFGKTSLLNRHASWLGGDWVVVSIALQLCDRSTDARFRRDFFAEMVDTLGNQSSWLTLRIPIQQRKTAFLLDELGACSDSQIAELLERFHRLSEIARGNLKLIVSFRDHPTLCLARCGFRNPKHRDAWKVIHLSVLTSEEVRELINLFPISLAALLHSRLDRLRAITDFKPQATQYLFNSLWEHFRELTGKGESIHLLIDELLNSLDGR